MFRLAALAALTAAAACASGESSSDAGTVRIDAAPLPDSGPRLIDGSTVGDIDGDIVEGTAPVINELVADHSGTDNCELIEVSGTPSASYAGYTLLYVEGNPGNPGVVDRLFEIGTTSADGLWVTAAQPANTLENDTATILLVEDYTGGLTDLD